MRLIDADELKDKINSLIDDTPIEKEDEFWNCAVELCVKEIGNAPTVEIKELELKPLVDKVVEILPELTDEIIKELPKIVNGKIKCSECSYYINTCKGCGADMRKEAENE